MGKPLCIQKKKKQILSSARPVLPILTPVHIAFHTFLLSLDHLELGGNQAEGHCVHTWQDAQHRVRWCERWRVRSFLTFSCFSIDTRECKTQIEPLLIRKLRDTDQFKISFLISVGERKVLKSSNTTRPKKEVEKQGGIYFQRWSCCTGAIPITLIIQLLD